MDSSHASPGAMLRPPVLTQGLRRFERSLTVGSARVLSVYSAAAHGRPEAEDVEVEARQAPRAARDLRAARLGVPDVPAAEAPAPRVPELQDLQGTRDR